MEKERIRENRLEGLSVKVYDNKIDLALKILKRKVKNSGLLTEYQDNMFFVKNSEKKKRKRELAKALQRKKSKEELEYNRK